MARLQDELVAGRLDHRHGTVILDDPDAIMDGKPFAHYVCEVTQCSARAAEAVHHPLVLAVIDRAPGTRGLAARGRALRGGLPGRPTRRGDLLLADRLAQRLAVRPPPRGVAVGRLHHPPRRHLAGQRLPGVVPRSHLGGPTRCPWASSRSPARSPSTPSAGDIIFHDAHLWHAAARATDDRAGAVRRHLVAGGYGGTRLAPTTGSTTSSRTPPMSDPPSSCRRDPVRTVSAPAQHSRVPKHPVHLGLTTPKSTPNFGHSTKR